MTDAPSTERFTDRVDDYVRYRPTYPAGVIEIVQRETGLLPPAVFADIGSGTGISAKLFLDAGYEVFGVEPNAAMRAAGERFLSGFTQFQSISGTSEHTTLADRSVDGVIAAQAFHWFDPGTTRRELVRITKPSGWCVLLWNSRRRDATPFLRDYENLLLEYGTDYETVRHENIDPAAIATFYCGPVTRDVLPNYQSLDYAGLQGRLTSSSYAPKLDDPRFAPMLTALRRIFDQYAEHGAVHMDYDTEVYVGSLS